MDIVSFYDFNVHFYPAFEAVLNGQSPYLAQGFFSPPWALLSVLPFLVLKNTWLRLLFLAIITYYAVYKYTNSWKKSLFFTLFPLTLYGYMNASLDWLVLLGMVLPSPIGVPLMLVKPQIGYLPALYGLYKSPRSRWVMVGLGILSLAIYNYPFVVTADQVNYAIDGWWNAAAVIWPYSIILSIPLAILGWKAGDYGLLMGASLLSSPYFAPYSIPFFILPFFTYSKWRGQIEVFGDSIKNKGRND